MFFDRQSRNPKFSVGEKVRVKSRDGVLKSLDSTNKLDGCLFMEQMWDSCGRTYQILKVVSSFFNERQRRTFRPRAPVYILENLICEGKVKSFPFKCDHSCFLLWHEDWLDK
jgi:hypothetical protein